jgi:hypothetical protein
LSRKCSICVHKKRNDIEKLLVEGALSFRHIASQYGVNYRSLQRHKENGHIEEALIKAHDVEKIVYGEDLLGKILHLQKETLQVLEEAKKYKKHVTVLNAVGKASGLIEIQEKLAGQLHEKQINIFLHPDFIEMRSIILQVLDPHPEIKHKVAEALFNAHRNGTSS